MNDLKAFHEMRSKKIIHIISCHAEGEVGDVIVGGVSPPPGESIWEQSRWIDQDQSLRRFVLNEPRGGVSGMRIYWYLQKIKRLNSDSL